MDNIVEARNNMHARNAKKERDKKSKVKKVKNFFQVCQEQEDGKNRVICTVYRESDKYL